MLSLARIYMRLGDAGACHSQCVSILNIDPSNEEATMLLSDILFRFVSLFLSLCLPTLTSINSQSDYDSAVDLFRKLLEEKPSHYGALVL